MAVALSVIDGGWQKDEAHIEALAFMAEVQTEADELYDLVQQLEATYRLRSKKVLDPRWRRAERKAARLMRRAQDAAREYRGLLGGNDAA